LYTYAFLVATIRLLRWPYRQAEGRYFDHIFVY